MKNILIVGANRGIGLALVEEYQMAGDKVYALCRKSSKELEAINNIKIIEGAEVSDFNKLKNLANQIEDKIDIMIHVSGIWRDDNLMTDVNWDHFSESFEINSIAPLKSVIAFKSCLNKGAKIGLMSSRMGSIEDNTSGGRYAYRMSKTALNSAGKSLSHDLKEDNMAVAILHPGFVQTDMTDGNGNLTPKESAQGLKKVMDNLTMNNSGEFFHSNGEILPW